MTPENLDNSIKMLKKGLSHKEVVLGITEDAEKNSQSLVALSELLEKIPKNTPPSPALRRKYILAQSAQKIWLPFLHISRFAAGSTAFILLLALFSAGAVQAFKSTPGQTLFSVKRTAENVRLIFVMSDSAKAELQLKYATSRLSEAESILKNPSRNKEQEIAAFEELKNQTQIAAESLKQVAINKPLESKNLPLANQLEDLAKKQTELIQKNSSEDADVKLAVSGAKDASKLAASQATQIKNYLAVAGTTQDPVALADLSVDPNAVIVLGNITKLDKSQIVVEKTTFQISSETQIQDSSGNKLENNSLKNDIKVKVVGKKDSKEKILATSITLIDTENPGVIKGTSTSTPTGTATPENIPASLSTSTKATQAEEETLTPEKPRLGSFIIENPNPQYNP